MCDAPRKGMIVFGSRLDGFSNGVVGVKDSFQKKLGNEGSRRRG